MALEVIMTATVTIQNADKTLVDALKSLVKLSPMANIKIKKTEKDDFYSEENINYLKELKRLENEGKLSFTEHELIEV